MPTIKRQELKYFLSPHEARIIRERLLVAVPRDEYSQEGSYFIRSLYFDNPANASYFDRNEGFETRRKFRIRLYEFTDKAVIKFEIKTKHNTVMSKETALITRADVTRILAGDYECLLRKKDPTLCKIYYHFKREFFTPAVIVDYQREAFTMDYNDIRITFDTILKKSREIGRVLDPTLRTIPVLERKHIILEVKYNHFFPGWLSDLLGGFNYQRCAQSKYCFARLV